MRTGEIEIKITDHDDNNNDIITQEFNILIAENFSTNLKQASLATKADILMTLQKRQILLQIKQKHLEA